MSQHAIQKAKDSDSIAKLFATYLRRTEESALGELEQSERPEGPYLVQMIEMTETHDIADRYRSQQFEAGCNTACSP